MWENLFKKENFFTSFFTNINQAHRTHFIQHIIYLKFNTLNNKSTFSHR